MSLDQVISLLPRDLGPVFGQIDGKPVVVTANSSNNIAKDNAVQVCGPVAGRIEYIFNLSFHYHAGDKGSCWRLVGGDVPVREGCQIEPDHGPPGAGKWIEESREMAKSVPKNKQVISSKPAKAAKTQQILLHGSRKGAMPVIAIVDPNNEGDWIAARIVIRLGLKHEKVDNHKTVPDIKGQSFEKTRIFVDLSCGGPEDRGACIRRFFVVNHCDVFDILIGTMIR